MTEQTQEEVNVDGMLSALTGFTEAPASLNVYGVTRKGWNIQVTLRDADEFELLKRFGRMVAHFDDIGIAPKPVGQQPLPPRADVGGSIESHPLVLPPVPTAQTNGGAHEAQCVLIEVGTSYSGGKPQLKFTCDGLEHPLTFTKPVGEMVKLLAPLGYTAEHLTIGKKYGANCTVRYTENTNADGKTYKNVQSVTPR